MTHDRSPKMDSFAEEATATGRFVGRLLRWLAVRRFNRVDFYGAPLYVVPLSQHSWWIGSVAIVVVAMLSVVIERARRPDGGRT